MLTLPKGCARSEIKVISKDWDFDLVKEKTILSPSAFSRKAKELIEKPWAIVYRFYNPSFEGTDQWGKLIKIQRMNGYKEVEEWQEFTRNAIEELTQILDQEGYNPITNKFLKPQAGEINATTPLSLALDEAFLKLKCAEDTKTAIRKSLVHIQSAVKDLQLSLTPVSDVKIRNCISILNKVREMKYKKRDVDLIVLESDLKNGNINQAKYEKDKKKNVW